MKTYKVEIKETTVKTYVVKATDAEEARTKAIDRYEDGDLGDDPNWERRGDYSIYNVTEQ
jgi:hypothetical protein